MENSKANVRENWRARRKGIQTANWTDLTAPPMDCSMENWRASLTENLRDCSMENSMVKTKGIQTENLKGYLTENSKEKRRANWQILKWCWQTLSTDCSLRCLRCFPEGRVMGT